MLLKNRGKKSRPRLSLWSKTEKECEVGISELQKMLVSMINLMSKAKLVMFDTVEEGLECLAG